MAKTKGKGPAQGSAQGPASSSMDAKLAAECNAILRDWTKGQRAKAKKSLQRLCKESPHSHLPHRYLARVYYHEAAVLESVDPGGKPSSELRLGLLTSALEAARAATELNPHSLSSAALRATCVVNVLVEESSLFGNSGASQGQNGQAATAGRSSSDGLTATRCQRIKQEFKDALAACTQALNSQTPTLFEPVISIQDGSSQTTDPCCLRVQDQIQVWCREGRWDRIAQEKRSVLSCMTQVLESCYTLLDSTQIPVDGIVRLLQHILRPQQQELQMWASQLLLGRGMTLEDLQKKFETQAAVAELLKMLRPNGREMPPLALAQPLPQSRPSAGAGAGASSSQPAGLQQGQVQAQPQQQHQQQVGSSAQQQQQQQQQQQLLQQQQQQQQQQYLLNDRAVTTSHHQHRHLQPVRPPRPEPSQCLSIEKDWDKDAGPMGSQHPGGGMASNNNNRRRPKKAKTGGSERKKERTRYERYMDVESFWKSTTVEQRRELLRVPMSSLLHAVRQEHGPEAAEEVCEGLVLLREQGNRSARYWACPICEQRFSSRKDYSSHVELLHEELAVLGDKYVACAKCQMEVVGMYYTAGRVPGYHVCFRCYHADMRAGTLPEEAGPFEKVIPRSDAKGRAWSDTSDFISTRDSFSSLDEEGYNNSLGGAPGAAAAQAAQAAQAGYAAADAAQQGQGQGTPRSVASVPVQALQQQQSHGQQQAALRPSVAAAQQPPQQQPQRQSPPQQHTGPGSGSGGSGSASGSASGSGGAPVAVRSASSDGALPRPTGRQWDRREEPGGAGEQDPSGGGGAPAGGQSEDGANGLWRSWWPRRLMPSWSSSEREKAKQKGEAGQEQSQGQGQGPPAQGQGAEGASQQQHGGNQPQGEQQPKPASAQQPGLGQTGQQGGGQHGGGGGAAAQVQGQTQGARGSRSAGAGSAAEDEGADFGGELHEVIQVVEEVMRRMRDIYGADREVGDMTLGSITQFVHRKLSTMLDEIAPQEEAPVVRQCLDEFMDQPSCVFQKPDVLRAVLGCLPFRDLQMVLAYVVRQHAEALARVEEGGSNASGSGSVDGDDEDSECDEDDEECDEECDEEDDECDEEDEECEEEEEEEEFAGASLFQVVVHDEGVFHQLIADCWNAEDSDDAPPAPQPGAQGQRGSPGGDTGQGGAGGKRGAGAGQAASGSWLNLSSPQDQLNNGLVVAGSGAGVMPHEPFLEVTDWWLEHLALKSKEEEREAPDGQAPGTTELRWLYGKVVLQEADEFMARQRELRAGRDRETVILELYDDLAYAWRSLQATTDKRNRLEELRRNVRAQFALVKQLEEERNQCTLQQATEFLNAVSCSHCNTAQQPGQPPSYLYLCEQAVDVVRRYPALAQEPSQRYARALLDRELAVLLLSEAMLMADAEEAAREKQAAEEQLKKQRQEAKEVEAEYQRVEAEGPASHRKKDLLDKATKEAEHRERLQDLLSRLTSLNERVVLEDSSRQKWAQRSVEAERDLEVVRTSLRNHANRKKHLEDVCAQLDCPVPPAALQQQMQQAAIAQQQQQQQQGQQQQTSVALPQQQQGQGPVEGQAHACPGVPPQAQQAQHAPTSAPAPAAAAGQPAEGTPVPGAASPAVDPAALVAGAPPAAAPAASGSAAAAAATPNPGPSAAPAAAPSPEASSSSAPGSSPNASQQQGQATSPGSAPIVPVPPTPPPAPTPPPPSATSADMEWRAQRLECLMYRVLWVSEAIQAFREQYSPHSGGQHYELFIKSTNWAKSLADDYDEQIKGWLAELDKLRRKLCEASCVDLGYDLAAFAQEVACRRVEEAARRARETASLTLLRELEEEEAAKAGGEGKGEGKGGEGAGGGGKGAKKNKAKGKADKAREKKEKEELERVAKLAEDEVRRQALEAEKQRLAAARLAREAAIEAELERRRRELEELETRREAEAIRAAQEASLREQKEAAARKEREQREAADRAKEREREEAAALAVAAAAAQDRKVAQQVAAKAAAAGVGMTPAAAASAGPVSQVSRHAKGAALAPATAQTGAQAARASAVGAPAAAAVVGKAGAAKSPGKGPHDAPAAAGVVGSAAPEAVPVDRQKRNAKRGAAGEATPVATQGVAASHVHAQQQHYHADAAAASAGPRAPANKQQRGGAGPGAPPPPLATPAAGFATSHAGARQGAGGKQGPHAAAGAGASPLAGPSHATGPTGRMQGVPQYHAGALAPPAPHAHASSPAHPTAAQLGRQPGSAAGSPALHDAALYDPSAAAPLALSAPPTPASMQARGGLQQGHGWDVSAGAASASASPGLHGYGGGAGRAVGLTSGYATHQELLQSQALLKQQQQQAAQQQAQAQVNAMAQAAGGYRGAGPGRQVPGQGYGAGPMPRELMAAYGAQPGAQAWMAQVAKTAGVGAGPHGMQLGGFGRSPGPGERSSQFDPFAENPLLAAFSVAGNGPAGGPATAASSGQAMAAPSAASGAPRGSPLSPGAASGAAQGTVPPSATSTTSPPASSGFATPALTSPRAPMEEPLSPSSLNSSFAAPAPDTDHILSILSILEPEPTVAPSPGNGKAQGQQGVQGGRPRAGSVPSGVGAMAAGDSPASAAAAAEAVQRALSSNRSTGGSPSMHAGTTSSPDATAGAGAGSQFGGMAQAQRAQGAAGAQGKSDSGPSLSLLPGFPAMHSGYNIWSTGAGQAAAFGGTHHPTAAAAAAWGAPEPSSTSSPYASLDDSASRGSAASPPPRGMDWPRAASMHDIAAALPSSLLPASLELDGPPAPHQHHQHHQHHQQQQQQGRSHSLQQLQQLAYMQGAYNAAYQQASAGAGAFAAQQQQQQQQQAMGRAAGGYGQYVQRNAAAGGGGAARTSSASVQLRSNAPSWPLTGAAAATGSKAAGPDAAVAAAQQQALLSVAGGGSGVGGPPGSPLGSGLGGGGRYGMSAAGVGMGMALFSGDTVNWGHGAAVGRATNSTWAPFGAAPGVGGQQASTQQQQQQQQAQQQAQQNGAAWPRGSARQ